MTADVLPDTGATATDLFAGGGGGSEGMRVAGIRSVYALNHWPTAIETHSLNHPDALHVCADVTQFEPRRLKRTTILWASASCTKHSRAQGKRRQPGPGLFDDYDLGTLPGLYEAEPDRARATMLDVVRFAEVHRYEGVLVENVPEVMDWALFPYWLAMMGALGYRHRIDLVDASLASKYGPPVPQARVRFIASFWRGKYAPAPLSPTLAAPGADDVLEDAPGPLLAGRRLAPATLARIDATLARYPDAPRMLASYYGSSRVGRPTSLPMGTLTTVDRHGLITRTPDGVAYRMLSNLEQARAQGFPDSYRWAGSSKDVTKQIGNAVPIPTARDASRALVDALGRVAA